MEDMKAVCRETCDRINQEAGTDFKMTFVEAKAGYAWLTRGRFTIPAHALRKGKAYAVVYVCHEMAHLVGDCGHDDKFFMLEDRLCSIFRFRLERKKAYARCIYGPAGEIAYGQPAHPNETEDECAKRLGRNESSRRSKRKARQFYY